ncbi:unnamed protein product [Calicophoron daubneyi]|uniref:Uncharacterized protein n=1 Tax=Calicophoron daubneyi TaxID=300641 RepID=A0AAV2T0J5_CALDB
MQPTEGISPDFSNSDESLPCYGAEEHFQPRKVAQSLVAMGSDPCFSCMRLQQHHQRRLRSKHMKHLFPEAMVEKQTNILRHRLIPTSTGLVTVLVVLLGIVIAVFRFHEDSIRITELKEELALAKLEHANAMSGAERQLREKDAVIEQLRTERNDLKRSLDNLFTERRMLKDLLKEIRRDYIHLPGGQFVKRILCQILRICPDFHD